MGGLAIATSISFLLNFFIITVYTVYNSEFRKTWVLPRLRMFRTLGKYVRLAIPSLFMLCLPWWGFEAQFYIASQLSLKAAATQVIMANISSLFYQVPQGIAIAACITVGTNLGSGQWVSAKGYAKFIIKASCVISLIIIAGIMLTKSYIPRLFTDDLSLVENIQSILPIYCVYYFFDSLQGSQIGIIKGMGL